MKGQQVVRDRRSTLLNILLILFAALWQHLMERICHSEATEKRYFCFKQLLFYFIKIIYK